MREPKWTDEQTEAHLKWWLNLKDRTIEAPEDRDELHFCLNYYANTPEGRRQTQESIQRNDALRQATDQQAIEAAAIILETSENAILQALRDATQHEWVKHYIAASCLYSRRVLEYIINEGDPSLRWHVMGHPDIRTTDLQKLSRDPQCTPFVRGEVERHLQDRLDSQQAVC
jgi:hypothetical protein